MLRAVNVGGHGSMRMADLKRTLGSAGMKSVRTYIQSGNAVFVSSHDRNSTSNRIAKALRRSLDYQGRVFLLTRAELARATRSNPMNPRRRAKDWALHLLFLSGRPSAGTVRELEKKGGDQYEFAARGRVLYYGYRRALAGRRRTLDMEGVLGLVGTSRTWKVAQALERLAAEAERA